MNLSHFPFLNLQPPSPLNNPSLSLIYHLLSALGLRIVVVSIARGEHSNQIPATEPTCLLQCQPLSTTRPWLKLKIYQWPEQKDPQQEKKRLRAIKQNELRMREKNEDLEIRLLIAKIIQGNERYKEEKANLHASISWLNQIMKRNDTFDDMSPNPGSSTL
ncbi:hypothetical protein Pmani_026366 [Petrolisthes manimaculis]|uniref:Uncharacterized protein n=1 Tax=Petrolisthes manimaculis TaxID=1843537 RepID=A0AAE1P4E8_9EUCA|nr:hypothetical protein Pmani_026366 [Petrolisthes manimaculis]